MLKELYTMNKYRKNNLTKFKSLWSDANINKVSEIDKEILNDTNENIKELYSFMKRSCGDYLYKANLIWENLINSKQRDAHKWFLHYSKVSREYLNENW
jgi:hypothetical protein